MMISCNNYNDELSTHESIEVSMVPDTVKCTINILPLKKITMTHLKNQKVSVSAFSLFFVTAQAKDGSNEKMFFRLWRMKKQIW